MNKIMEKYEQRLLRPTKEERIALDRLNLPLPNKEAEMGLIRRIESGETTVYDARIAKYGFAIWFLAGVLVGIFITAVISI